MFLVVVVELVHEPLVTRGQPFLAGRFGEGPEMPEVPFARGVHLAALDEQLKRVLADGFEQPVPRLPLRCLHGRDERLLHQAREQIEREARGHGARGTGVEAAHEHGQAPERVPLWPVQELVAPLHRGADRTVMRR